MGLPYSPLLNLQIISAELDGRESPSVQGELLTSRAGDAPLRARIDAWGAAVLPSNTVSSTDARVVLWSGALDPLDPPAWAERTAARWDAELVTVPSAGHAVMRYARTNDGNCAHGIWAALLADPSAEIDRTCLTDVESIDWRLERAETQDVLETWFGTQ